MRDLENNNINDYYSVGLCASYNVCIEKSPYNLGGFISVNWFSQEGKSTGTELLYDKNIPQGSQTSWAKIILTTVNLPDAQP